MVDQPELPLGEDAVRALTVALKRTGLVVAVSLAAAAGVTAAVFDPDADRSGRERAETTLYEAFFPSGPAVTDVECEESSTRPGLWQCEYRVEGERCTGLVLAGDFEGGRCVRP